jgi:hypothetical protein
MLFAMFRPHELVNYKHDGGGANFLAATSQFGGDEVIISYSMVWWGERE